MISIDMIYDAQNTISNVIRNTPIIATPSIGENIYIKSENLQNTGSFKLRGAFYKMKKLTEDERKNGVIACSAGNHAQGVAFAATMNNIKSTICIPAGASLAKIEATKSLGGEVILVPGVYDDAYEKAIELMKEKNLTFVHPFNDERVIAGQGTIGLEIIQQLPDVEAVIVPIGGGGLISGIAYAIKTLKPECKIYGVQAEGAASMYNSIKKNELTTLSEVSTVADGIAIKRPGDLTFEICKNYVDEIVTVSENEISTAILTLMEKNKTVAEGAGAVSVAAALFKKIDIKNKKTVCVVSGGNIDVNIMSRIITKGLIKTGRLTEFTTKVIDKPGHLINLLQLISEQGTNIFSVNHEREHEDSDIGNCIVSMVVETRDLAHKKELLNILKKHNYELL